MKNGWSEGVLLLIWLTVESQTQALEPPSKWNEPLEKPPLVMGQGEQRLLSTGPILKFSVGAQIVSILRISAALQSPEMDPSSEALLVKARTPGHTDLWIWKKDGGIEYRKIEIKSYAPSRQNSKAPSDEELKNAVSKLNELEVTFTEKGASLSGVLKTLSEARNAFKLIETFKPRVQAKLDWDPKLVEATRAQIQDYLDSEFGKQFRVEFESPIFLIDWDERSQLPWPQGLENRLQQKFPFVSLRGIPLGRTDTTLFIRAYLVELMKSEFESFGIEWGSEQSGVGSMRAKLNVQNGAFTYGSDLDATLKMLSTQGGARVLSQPQIVVRTPGEAELFSGGELPIRTLTRFQSQLQWKKFGLLLKIKALEKMDAWTQWSQLDLETELSGLDPSLSTEDGIPGLRTNHIRTQVEARLGHPLFLCGLISEDQKESSKGFPILREIPVIGSLFGSNEFRQSSSELVMILYPSRMKTIASPKAAQLGLPRGPMPPPRNWISPSEMRNLKLDKNYPWNVFGDAVEPH